MKLFYSLILLFISSTVGASEVSYQLAITDTGKLTCVNLGDESIKSNSFKYLKIDSKSFTSQNSCLQSEESKKFQTEFNQLKKELKVGKYFPVLKYGLALCLYDFKNEKTQGPLFVSRKECLNSETYKLIKKDMLLSHN